MKRTLKDILLDNYDYDILCFNEQDTDYLRDILKWIRNSIRDKAPVAEELKEIFGQLEEACVENYSICIIPNSDLTEKALFESMESKEWAHVYINKPHPYNDQVIRVAFTDYGYLDLSEFKLVKRTD